MCGVEGNWYQTFWMLFAKQVVNTSKFSISIQLFLKQRYSAVFQYTHYSFNEQINRNIHMAKESKLSKASKGFTNVGYFIPFHTFDCSATFVSLLMCLYALKVVNKNKVSPISAQTTTQRLKATLDGKRNVCIAGIIRILELTYANECLEKHLKSCGDRW